MLKINIADLKWVVYTLEGTYKEGVGEKLCQAREKKRKERKRGQTIYTGRKNVCAFDVEAVVTSVNV